MLFEQTYFWLILIGIIFIVVTIILLSLYGESDAWFWIFLSLGTTLFSVGIYWYLLQDTRKKREKFDKEVIQSAIKQAEDIGAKKALGYPVTDKVIYTLGDDTFSLKDVIG